MELSSTSGRESAPSPRCLGGQHLCHHCHASVALPVPFFPPNGAQSAYEPPGRPFHKSHRKSQRYSQRLGSEDFDQEEEEGGREVLQSVKSFKAELGKLNSEIKKLASKRHEDSSVQDILRKFIELKGDNERIVREKDDRIAALLRELRTATEQVAELKREVDFLQDSNAKLNATINEVLRAQKTTLGGFERDQYKSLFSADKPPGELERENEGLRERARALELRVEELREQLREAQRATKETEYFRAKVDKLQRGLDQADGRNRELTRETETLHRELRRGAPPKAAELTEESRALRVWETDLSAPYDDFLKCVYAQADYIETSLETTVANSIFRY